MKDIKIFKKCKWCKGWLTLMESLRAGNDKTYLGTRCLRCGWSGFTELWEVVYKAELQHNERNPFAQQSSESTTGEKHE